MTGITINMKLLKRPHVFAKECYNKDGGYLVGRGNKVVLRSNINLPLFNVRFQIFIFFSSHVSFKFSFFLFF